ncbi:MAG: VWA domain-containing protein [Gammaproteobacteria bacterium]|nr:VWA domain-containing protein [Gammaproteobacteria bacterium]
MIHFDWIWSFLALPLPYLVYKFFPAAPRQNEAPLHVPFMQDFESYSTDKVQSSGKLLIVLAAIAWLLLVMAAARPQWLGDAVELPVSGRDLMLAVDLSGSMEVEDFQLNGRLVDRLSATKAVATEFIERRNGDRLGLILFGKKAYLQTPLTFDRQTVSTLLGEAVIGLAGKETAIGDAIGLAVKRLEKQSVNSRVLVLLTDGANTAGEVEPLKAAELAKQYQLKIYTIGIGADEMIVRSIFGSRRVNPSADLDEKTLAAIASKTGGKYFRARNTEQLNQIYQLLDQLEPVDKETQSFRPTSALFYWPLSFALLICALIISMRLVTKGRL